MLARVRETRDFRIGFDYVNRLLDGQAVIDSNVSVTLSGMDAEWIPSEHEGESFLDAVIRETPLTQASLNRHTKIQKLLTGDIPDEFRERIECGGQKSLIQIANLKEDGYELEHGDWLRIHEKVEDDRAVAKVIREITGRPPRSNFINHFYDEENGVVYAWVNGKVVEAGRMNMDDDPDVKKQRDVWISRSKMEKKENR